MWPFSLSLPPSSTTIWDDIYKIFDSLGYSLPEIFEEIAKEDEEKKRRRLRRHVAMEEKLKVCPPRLGKHK